MDFVRTPASRFEDLPGYAFESHWVTLANGLRLHYVEAGPADGEPVLLLHGQPTWSYLYRTVLPILGEHGLRAVAPDMIGFGQSDKPLARTDYSVRSHTETVLELMVALDLRGVTLVVQDWGGPIGLGACTVSPERVARMVATNTALHTADAALAGRLSWACHSTPNGEVAIEPSLLDYQRMTQELRPFSPSLFVQGATTTPLSVEVCAAYDAPFPGEEYCAGARQLPLLMGLTPNSAAARHNRRILEFLATAPQPLLTAFSDGDPSTDGWADVLQSSSAGAAGQAHCTITGAGHFLQEDAGPPLAHAILDFVNANPR